MKTLTIQQWLALALLVVLNQFLMVPVTQAANANPPGKMTFQGFLTDANTPPVPLGNTSPVNKEITFKIYDNGNGGNVKWAESQIVTIDKGHFSVLLGEGSSVSGLAHNTDLSSVFIGADASDRWMGITVDGVEITPRIQFFAAPYSQLAKAANSLTNGGTTNPITATGDFSVSGRADVFGDMGVQGYLGVSGNGGITGNFNVQGILSSGSLDVSGEVKGLSLNIVGDALLQRPNGTSLNIQTPDSDARIVAGAPSHTLLLNPFTGKVGIRTSTPSAMLQIGKGENVGPGGLVINTGWINTSNYGENRPFELKVRDQTKVVVNTQGFMGIGTTNPEVPLEIGIWGGITTTLTKYLSETGLNTWPANTPHTGGYSAKLNGWIQAPGFLVPSDKRIKEVKKRLDSESALASVRNLKVTDYHFVDKVASGDKLDRGFIAQEVAEILPGAISAGDGTVPDIYSKSLNLIYDGDTHLLSIELENPHHLKPNEIISMIDDVHGKTNARVVEVITPTQFVVSSDKPVEKVFVYGRKVDDFLTVNYDYVFTTGISAIQELDRQVQALKQSEKRITELEQQVARLTDLEAKAARVDGLEKQVAELSALVLGFLKKGGVSPVSLRGASPVTQ